MLGDIIAAARAERGWTRGELARRAGILTAMVAALEREEPVRPTPRVLAGVAAALGMPVAALEPALPAAGAGAWPAY
ncbi:MAG TPA: helix-turn-helix transcriptional regulator [Vicinamibacteria bacterium]